MDVGEAEAFLRLFHAEMEAPVPFEVRMAAIRAEIEATGTYEHTVDELTFGARVAWRNSARCIGRLYWNGLHVRDRRGISDPGEVARESVRHLEAATRAGRVRSTITVFAPDRPGRPGPRIVNEQLIRYAGYREPDGRVLGDPRTADLTSAIVAAGWQPPAQRGRFDVLPLLVAGDGRVEVHEVPREAVLEVPITHPELGWFADLGLRWYAVPAISNMPLEIGGVRYPGAPFNGYYLGTEIGARNFADADRYDQLPVVATRMGLDTSTPRSLWKDRALVELMRAVHHSFDAAGVSLADHHTESERFLSHLAKEERAGRSCPTDWSWIVPPMSGATLPVFHRYYDEPDLAARPAFLLPGS
ncbi:nitric oxide synthase oxygenase [Pseudonocardia ailaonensis]|uniref:nitric oxide synthase oxygenase n=1 Tax=Pseudonocardia ailaonensis TaxID=367279 RepID=UPI0031D808D3